MTFFKSTFLVQNCVSYKLYRSLFPESNTQYICISVSADTSAGHYLNQFWGTVYPKKYAQGFCFAVLCSGYTLTDFPISIRLTSLALWQSNDCPSASKATLINMDKYFMWIHYEQLHNHNKAKHNKTVCIFLGIYCTYKSWWCLVDPFASVYSDSHHVPCTEVIEKCVYTVHVHVDDLVRWLQG